MAVPKENQLATAKRKKLSGRTLAKIETTDPFDLNGNKRDEPGCPAIGEADGINGRAS